MENDQPEFPGLQPKLLSGQVRSGGLESSTGCKIAQAKPKLQVDGSMRDKHMLFCSRQVLSKEHCAVLHCTVPQ